MSERLWDAVAELQRRIDWLEDELSVERAKNVRLRERLELLTDDGK